MTTLDVYLHEDLVGQLERLPQARLRFTYEPAWVATDGAALSLGLPVRAEAYDDAECRPFFSGLLPEGGFLRAIARAFHVSAGNPFSVLAEIGGECAGAVSLAAPGTEPPFASAPPPTWPEEDLCQALVRLPEQKYEADGGPGVGACADLLRRHSAAPAVDLLALLDALAFNFAVGNGDAHAKNYSLLLEGGRAPRLAPLYDLLSTRAYGRRFGRKMAMKYGGEYRFDRIRGRHIERLARELGISEHMARTRIENLCERAVEAMPTARLSLPAAWQGETVLDAIEGVVRDSAERLRRAAAEPV